jgi:hypothetical protein
MNHSWKHFFCEEKCFELLLKKIQMYFSSNDLKFLYVDLLHMSRPWEKLQEWIFICFIWTKYEKKIHV